MHGRTLVCHPEQDMQINSRPRPHALDVVAWDDHHLPMKSSHLNAGLQTILRRLGLSTNVTSKVFQTTYTFKNVLGGSIPGWRLALQM